jgi:hypothetical protein
MTVLTRQQAVTELIDSAIEAYFAGRHATAITLAGAAETGMPPAEQTLFKAGIELFKTRSESEVAQVLNHSRNWLKHFDEEKPAQIDVSWSLGYVLRATTHYQQVYGEYAPSEQMTKLSNHLAATLRETLEPFNRALSNLGSAVRTIIAAAPPK